MDKDLTTKRSLIQKYFTKEMYLEIIKITKISNADNNVKGALICEYLRNQGIPFRKLGSGTNRIGIYIDGYAVKIALDQDGQIDNRREMVYSKRLQPYVVKTYECVPSGLILVCEYVTFFSLDDYTKFKPKMAEILGEIAKNYFIGDCGITSKNYVNWGTRSDGTICILDFAYIYDAKFSLFMCNCEDGAFLKYDSNFVNFICPLCERKYTFGQLRRRITKEQQEEEIGDIRRLSYNMTKPIQVFEKVKEFEPQPESSKKKHKKLDDAKLLIKKIKEREKAAEDIDDYWGF